MNFFFSSRRRHTFFFQAEDGIRDRSPSRGLGDVYKRQVEDFDLLPSAEPRYVWIVIERIGGPGGQVEDHFEVEALAEERVEIGKWAIEDE